MKTLLNEGDVKAIIINYFLSNYDNPLIISELFVGNFIRRVDLAVVIDGKFIAIEIKSERDNLSRLNGQVETYLKYFDKVIVVALGKHSKIVYDKFADKIGLWDILDGRVRILRRGRFEYPANKMNYIDLLVKRDLIVLLKKLGIRSEGLSSMQMKGLLEKKVSKLSRGLLRDVLFNSLRRKYSLYSNAMCKMFGEKGVLKLNDIRILKPSQLNGKANIPILKPVLKKIKTPLESNAKKDLFLEELARNSGEPVFGIVPDYIKILV